MINTPPSEHASTRSLWRSFTTTTIHIDPRFFIFGPLALIGLALTAYAILNFETETGHKSLTQVVRETFPTVAPSLDNKASFGKTTRVVDGHSYEGWESQRDVVPPPGMKPEEEQAWLAMLERRQSSGELRPFLPAVFNAPTVVEGNGIRVVLKTLSAQAAHARTENGKLVYRDAFPGTDSLHAASAQRCEEFLLLRSAQAPTRFEYEIAAGSADVSIRSGAVRFRSGGRELQIEAPWAVDASGRAGAVQWELGTQAADGSRKLALVLNPTGLSYPVVIDPSWSTTGSMSVARKNHTATLLQNGKVLVAGGDGGVTAELYDPVAGTWSPTGNLTTSRASHTATLLLNGKVLVAGGDAGKTSELYDPSAGTFTATGSLNQQHASHTATLLQTGKVLVAGGSTSGQTNSAELYDPALGTWTATGSLNTGRYWHSATLLANGKVLVAGGHGATSVTLSNSELYDPGAGTWTATTGSLAAPRMQHTATLLPNGKVLIAGGGDVSSALVAAAELYDTTLGTWSGTGSLNTPRLNHSASLLPNGKVLVAGGHTFSSAELYDPTGGTWTATSSLNVARETQTATLLYNGTVLIAGGANVGGSLSSAELYTYNAGSWTNTGNLNGQRDYHTATLLANGKVLVAGGEIYNGTSLSTCELYDPSIGTWSNTGSLNTARYGHTATLLANGQVLVAGGKNVSSAEVYDPIGGTWTTTGSLSIDRFLHTATLLPNGKVLAAGGNSAGSGNLNTSELYDPKFGTWSGTGNLSVAHYQHSATLLFNGKVLVVDGNGSTAELYDASLGTWTTTGSTALFRWLQTATLLSNGKVMANGGDCASGSSPCQFCQEYDPTGESWSYTGSLITARQYHAATLLPNGQVLVTGGTSFPVSSSSSSTSSSSGSSSTSSSTSSSSGASSSGTVGNLITAELFSAGSASWSATASMFTARERHTATLLNNGKVLVAGGLNDAGSINVAELYDVGLGFQAAWQPVLSSATSPLIPGQRLVLSGSGFRGISEASGGNAQNSASNVPLVQLRSHVNEECIFLVPDPTVTWSDSSFTSLPLAGFPAGLASVTVFVNGIPSQSRLISISAPSITATAGSGQSTPIATAFATNLQATVKDNSGTPVSGASVTFSAQASGVSGFFPGSALSAIATTDINGNAVAPVFTANNATGSYVVTATTPGLGAPASFNLTNSLGTTLTGLASSANPSVFGQSITFTAVVTSAAGTPTGTVAFMDGVTLLASRPLSSGTTTLTTSSLSIGTHPISAVYSGDANFSTSTSSTLTQTVKAESSATTLAISTNNAVFGTTIIFTVTSTGSLTTPTGTVTLNDGATVLGSASLVNGSAAFPTSTLAVGVHSIAATYAGDATHTASTSPAINVTITNASPAITSPPLAVPNPAGVGQIVTFTVGAADPDGDVLAYAWSFGDGNAGMGNGATHAYGSAGVFTASVVVTDAGNASATAGTFVTVKAPLVGTGNDSNGDGFSDDVEAAAGGSSSDPSSALYGILPSASAEALTLSKLSIHLKFSGSADSIGLSGLLPVATPVSFANKKVMLVLGGVMQTFTLTSKGKSTVGSNSLTLSTKPKSGQSMFTIKMVKGNFAALLAPLGLVNATVTSQVAIPVTMIFNEHVYQTTRTQTYAAKKGVSGATKDKK